MSSVTPTLPPRPSTIANLPLATTPLAGNEFAVISQNGVTCRVAANGFSVVGPTGPQGPVGATGPTGPQGPSGGVANINTGTTGQLGYYASNGQTISPATVGSGLTLSAGILSATGGGTVTTVSVTSANGFSGTVSNPTTAPAITLSTSINSPVLAGNGTAISGATTTGSGSTVVLNNSPSLITPALGTPSSGTLTNCTGLTVSGGGTGVASLTAYAVMCGGTTTTGAVQSIASVGSSGQVLTSNGAGALPTFQASGLMTALGVGSIIFGQTNGIGPAAGGTVAAASITPVYWSSAAFLNSSDTIAGTWRALVSSQAAGNVSTLWQRIA